ncbi:MAG: aminopeptidase, partial [Lachnospiraceae bacterium]|nr:aminopeptidase [Lachnospiraceae bacterium]
GYKEYIKGKTKLSKGDKIYINNRDKTVVLMTIGKDMLDGIHFVVSHIDSPRLDLKPNPLYQSDDIAYFKTHYYGGIRKYQWPTVPLSMHGRVFLGGGKYVDICIGEGKDDTRFFITDLLPHLADKQNERKLKEGINGEELNIIVGSNPIDIDDKEVKDKVKHHVLTILNKEYGIKEKDFVRAEIEFTPATKASDIGFDRSMIAAYGQDDRVCAYPALVAEIENKNFDMTSCAVFTDKEEIGSEGNTGMVSNFLFDIIEDICDDLKIKARDVYRKSICFSSDVNSAYDPTFADVFEKRNASQVNHGVVVTKYTGARGKSGANDASAETMARVVDIMDKNNVVWQIGELGKVDIGGGGTIAAYMSDRNIDTVDIGVAVLAMHAPYEVTSKLDIYHTYLAYKALLAEKN